jgi:hypothetical protein
VKYLRTDRVRVYPALPDLLGWQPSRFLSDRTEAERAFALAERLGSVNAAAAELGTAWPSLRKAFTRHGLGMPARNPKAVRQRAIAAARQRSGRPATPTLDPVYAALNPGVLPAREQSAAELYQWVRREEQYAILGANVVVELYSESHARQPTTGPGRSSDEPTAATGWPANAPAAPTEPTAPAAPTNPRSGRWRPMPAEPTGPHQRAASGSTLVVYLDVVGSWPKAPPGYESIEHYSEGVLSLPAISLFAEDVPSVVEVR